MTLDFYTNPMSRGQIARWALEEVGAPYTEHLVAYGPEMKGPAYTAINPMGKVPALRHDGRVVTEAAAICAYLAEAFPEAGLAPTPGERADYYRWFFFGAGPVEQAITARSMKWEPTAEQQAMLGFGSFDLVLKVLAELLGSRDYVCGDRFTMADVYLGSQIDFGLQFESLPSSAPFLAYVERLRGRDAYSKAKGRDSELIGAQQAGKG